MNTLRVMAMILVAAVAGGVAAATSDQAADEDGSTVGPPGFVAESELPAGFPEPGPVGKAVVKRYPEARMARTPTGQFMRLFGHIQRERIAMTTPVMMTPSQQADAEEANAVPSRGMSMAFFYPDPETGQLGGDNADDRVTVERLPARTAVSYGFFGRPNQQRLDAARTAIEERIAAEGLTSRGSWRLMSYNSPMIPAGLQFYEVQQPVESPDEEAATATQSVDSGE